jgi:aromatic-L-amino-acid decarboxylase
MNAGNSSLNILNNLNLSKDEFTEFVNQACDKITEHISALETKSPYTKPDLDDFSKIPPEIPAQGESFNSLIEQIFTQHLSSGLESGSPYNFAYVPGGGIMHSAIADLISTAVNRYVSVWSSCPGFAQIETTVLRWFSNMMDYPESSRGILTSGSSLASFSAILCAREKYFGSKNMELQKGIAYASDVSHYSISKNFRMAGFNPDNFHMIDSDNSYKIKADELHKQIIRDKRSGKKPFLIIATAGTTKTGTVDGIEALSEIAREENLWLHVDAAYGGFFILTDKGKRLLRGINQADSISLDPHKSLFIPYGSGALLVKEGKRLFDAHYDGGDRYSSLTNDNEFIDYCEHSPELSREMRSLRIWLPLKLLGIDPFKLQLQDKLEYSRYLTKEIRKIDGIEIVSEPCLSIMTFRYHDMNLSEDELRDINVKFLNRINSRSKIHIIGVRLREKYVLRFCVLSFRSSMKHVKIAVDEVRDSFEELQKDYLSARIPSGRP